MEIRIQAPTLACSDMLRRIFKSENIEYKVGIGASNTWVYFVDQGALSVLQQWKTAINSLDLSQK